MEEVKMLGEMNDVVVSLADPKDNSSTNLTSIRAQNDLVMKHIYSFLPLEDRFCLRQVDRWFSKDHEILFCCAPAGVYGHANLNIHQAFQKVRDYLEFQGTPESLHVTENIPDCWQSILEYNPHYGDGHSSVTLWHGILHRIADMFDEATGLYDLEDLQQELQEDEDHDSFRWMIYQELQGVNAFRRETQEKLEKVRAEIQAWTAVEFPCNALFDLLQKHKLPTQPFLTAESPQIADIIGSDEYPICRRAENGELVYSYLEHLKPGCRLSYRDVTGALVEESLKHCDNCYEKRGDFHACRVLQQLCFQ